MLLTAATAACLAVSPDLAAAGLPRRRRGGRHADSLLRCVAAAAAVLSGDDTAAALSGDNTAFNVLAFDDRLFANDETDTDVAADMKEEEGTMAMPVDVVYDCDDSLMYEFKFRRSSASVVARASCSHRQSTLSYHRPSWPFRSPPPLTPGVAAARPSGDQQQRWFVESRHESPKCINFFRPCSVANESKEVGEDWRGLKKILTCRVSLLIFSNPMPHLAGLRWAGCRLARLY